MLVFEYHPMGHDDHLMNLVYAALKNILYKIATFNKSYTFGQSIIFAYTGREKINRSQRIVVVIRDKSFLFEREAQIQQIIIYVCFIETKFPLQQI